MLNCFNFNTLYVLMIQDSQWLVEARRIRAEQDQAYAESLAIDQAKVYSCNNTTSVLIMCVVYHDESLVCLHYNRMPRLNSSRYNTIIHAVCLIVQGFARGWKMV